MSTAATSTATTLPPLPIKTNKRKFAVENDNGKSDKNAEKSNADDTNSNSYDNLFSRRIVEQKIESVMDSTESSLINPNTVINAYYTGQGSIDLEKLARLYPEVELNTERFAAAIVRIVPPNSCGLVFGVRKVIISGVKTLSLIIYTAKKYGEFLQRTGFNVERITFVIMNRVICFNTGYKIDLKRLSEEIQLSKGIISVTYEKPVFPGCFIEVDESYGVKKIAAFKSGRMNFIGVANETNAKRTFVMLEKECSKFKLDENIPTTKETKPIQTPVDDLVVNTLATPSAEKEITIEKKSNSDEITTTEEGKIKRRKNKTANSENSKNIKVETESEENYEQRSFTLEKEDLKKEQIVAFSQIEAMLANSNHFQYNENSLSSTEKKISTSVNSNFKMPSTSSASSSFASTKKPAAPLHIPFAKTNAIAK